MQIGADPEDQVIVATTVSQDRTDAPVLLGVLLDANLNAGLLPKEVSADARYFSDDNVLTLIDLEVDPLAPPHKIRHTDRRQIDLVADPPPADVSQASRMRTKLKDPVQYPIHQTRQKTVEPIFG